MSTLTTEIKELRTQLSALHAEPVRYGLVAWTAGNVSARVGGVVHTHSTYACAWAARGEPVPCMLTAMAGELGGAEIPVGPFALVGDDSIGHGIVETLAGQR